MSIVIRDDSLKRTGGFVSYPKCVLRDTLLNPTAKLAYAFFLVYAWDFQDKKLPRKSSDGGIEEFDTVFELTKDIGSSEPTVRRAIKSLEDRELIESKRIGQGKPNKFFVNSLRKVYPDDPDLSKMIDQDSDRSQMIVQERSITTTLDLSNLTDQSKMTSQDWSNLRSLLGNEQNLRDANSCLSSDRSNLINPNVNVQRIEELETNVNVRERQLDLNGLPEGIRSRLYQISDEIVSCTDGKRRATLELTFRMLEQFGDLHSERFYLKVASLLPTSDIETGLSYARDLEKCNGVKTNSRRVFTDFIKRAALNRGIKLTKK